MVRMFVYIPIHNNPNADGYVTPSIDVQGPELLKSIMEARKAGPDPAAAAGGGGGGGGYGNQNNEEMKAAKNFHHAKGKDWIDILAWSHGTSTKNVQDLSFTKYSDQYTPIYAGAFSANRGSRTEARAVMVMTREIVPHAFLRIIGQPKPNKLSVTEYKFLNVQCVSSLVVFLSGNRLSDR